MEQEMPVCGKTYTILRLLGKGKGGYSYLAERDGVQVVLKQIHHEPCSYYTFGNKIEAEQRDYLRLREAGIRIPEMIAVDPDAERIVKEYIEGPTVFDLVRDGRPVEPYLRQVREMAAQAKSAGLTVKATVVQTRELGKAQAMGELAGFFKLITEEGTGRLVGAHIAGAHASDLIAEAALAMQKGCTAEDLARTIHAHPTLAEGLKEAALR